MKSLDELISIKRPLREKPQNIVTKVCCDKCLGTGKLVEYTHVKSGKCFSCNGRGYFDVCRTTE